MTKKEHDRFQFENNEFQCSQRLHEYQLGYQNAVMDFQKQLNLRNRNVTVKLPKKSLSNQTSTCQSNKYLTSKEVVQNVLVEKDVSKEKDLEEIVVNKVPEIKK